MSGDIESLLRSEMAQRVDAAPAATEDPGLADLAIAGAGRIRHRRRVAAAASGAGLLVLGAATFVWQPWVAPDPNQGTLAAGTSTTEAQNELDMEFVVEDETGSYSVLNSEGSSVVIDEASAEYGVYRLEGAYMAETQSQVALTGFDGAAGEVYDKPTTETYTRVNYGGTQFAMVTPDAAYTEEEYRLQNVTLADGGGQAADVTFTTAYELTLMDWSASTAVFSADLMGINNGGVGNYLFDDDYDWNLASVGAAGFESAAIADVTDPNYVCVADLEAAVGLARNGEQCGDLDSDVIQDELVAASADEEAPELVREYIEYSQATYTFPMIEDFDFGEYRDRYFESALYWTDPYGRWELTGSLDDETWLLLDASTEEASLSELSPPVGAVMPVLDYTRLPRSAAALSRT